MKKVMFIAVATAMMGVFAQTLSLSDARAKIGDVIENPSALASTLKSLSAENQRLFLADVNEAVAKMPDSAEAKTAKFLDVARTALKGAKKGTVADMLAEVFATASVESLTVINEVLAADMFNRALNPSVKYTDERFVNLAKATMEKIAARNSKVDDGAVRTGFAALMFIRASNGSPADLADTLAMFLPEDFRESAKTEWFPAALAKGDEKSYDPMLGPTDAGTLPNERVVLRLAAAQEAEFLLADLPTGMSKNAEMIAAAPFATDRGGIGSGLDDGLYRVQFAREPVKVKPVPPEPFPYYGQTSGGQSGVRCKCYQFVLPVPK